MLFGTSLRILEIGMAHQRHCRARFGGPHAPPSLLIMGWEIKCSWPSFSAFPTGQDTGTGAHSAQWPEGLLLGLGKSGLCQRPGPDQGLREALLWSCSQCPGSVLITQGWASISTHWGRETMYVLTSPHTCCVTRHRFGSLSV